MKLNLETITDGLEGKWWHYIRSSDFAFQSRIPNQKEIEVNDDDILLHKEILEGESFPTKRFHLIMDDEAFEVEGKEIRDNLSTKCLEYIKQHKKLPFACTFKKIQKNGMVIIQYNPNGFDNFQLKITVDKLGLEGKEIEDYFETIKAEKDNPFANSDDVTLRIDAISEDPILEQVSMESGKSKAFVIMGEIIEIDLRKSYFQGNETIFYILQVKGGKLASDNKKNALLRDFTVLNAKCSRNAMEKYELTKGDIVSFNGKVKLDKKLKLIVQNIRKFEKSTE